jgi:4-amino-4-deoxy-L-arabinose transferase-like glycosyltransferase
LTLPDTRTFRSAPFGWLVLAVILLAAAGLRLWNVGQQDLWSDEALTVVLAHWPVGEMIWYPADETPFLYYTLHKALFSGEAGAAEIRMISVAAGLLSVLAMYWLGRLSLGRTAGLLCAALLAVWPFHVDYSQEARSYSLLFLLTVVSAASLLWWFRETQPGALRRPRIRYAALFLYALSTSLTFYTHVLATLWIAISLQIIVSLASRLRTRGDLMEVGAALGAMALLALPGMVRLVRKLGTPDAFHWLPQASPMEFVETTGEVWLPSGLWLNAAIGSTGYGPYVATLVVGLIIGTILVVAISAGRSRRLVPAADVPAVGIALGLLALPFIIWGFGYVIRPVFMHRTILFSVPGMILLIAAAVASIPHRRARAAVGVGTVTLYLAATFTAGTVRQKEDWTGVNAFLAAEARAGDSLIVCPAWKFPAARHAALANAHVPALSPVGGKMLLLEREFGAHPAWSQRFFQDVTSGSRAIFRGAARSADTRELATVAAGRSIWIVTSECDRDDQAVIEAWVGPENPWNVRWQSEGASPRDRIAVHQARLRQPLSKEVRVRSAGR